MQYLPRNFVAFACLMGASVVATLAMSPALMFLLDPTRPTSFADESVDPVQFVIGFGVANVILSSVAIAVGLLLEPSVRIGVPLLRPALAIREGASRPMLRCSALSFGLA